jgi:hypothetical protein
MTIKTLNKAQQKALLAVFERTALVRYDGSARSHDNYRNLPKLTYRGFRRMVRFAFFDDCAMVPWCGMILGIEADGYTHS